MMLIHAFFEGLLGLALIVAIVAVFLSFPGKEITLIVALLVALFSVIELIFYYYHQKKHLTQTTAATEVKKQEPSNMAVEKTNFLSKIFHHKEKTKGPLETPVAHSIWNVKKQEVQQSKKLEAKPEIATEVKKEVPKRSFLSWVFHKPKVETASIDKQEKNAEVQLTKEKPAEKHSIFAKIFHKEEKTIEPIAVKPAEPIVQKKEEKKQSALPGKEYDLVFYIENALTQGFPKSKIKEAALKAKWPADAIDVALDRISKKRLKKKVSILFLMIALLFGISLWLKVTDNFLYPYWIKTLSYQSTGFYVGAMFVLIAIVVMYGMHIRKVVQLRHAEIVEEQEQNVEEIKQTINLAVDSGGSDQTDLDRLYGICISRGKLTVGEVAKLFNIPKATAEEWGKILKEQGLIDLYYPTVGEPELRCKK